MSTLPPEPFPDPRLAQAGAVPMSHEERYRAIYGYDAPSRVSPASWGARVLGYLIDFFFAAVASIPLGVGYVMVIRDLDLRSDPLTGELVSGASPSGASIGMLVLGAVVALGFFVWNQVIRQGSTGYTLGKTVMGIRLVSEATGQPVGAGLSFVRQLAHVVDNVVCYLGWLWPLWDPKRQTLADKIMGTVVVVQPQEQSPR